jgi:hypothetical protein
MNPEEERLYRQLEAVGGAPVEPAGGEPELSDAEVEAMIAAMVRDDQQEALYQQLSNLGR